MLPTFSTDRGRSATMFFMRLCMMTFYFGDLPSYFELTLRSMGTNEDVDWVLFTDQTIASPPPNVTIERRTFDEFTKHLQNHFDYPLNVPRPYKLADTRPAFGYIFEERLAGYDLWGFSDLDIIFGSITKFLTREVSSQHAKFFLRGHFSIYQNTDEARDWFRNEEFGLSFRDAMANPAIQYWDEWPGINKIIAGLEVSVWDPLELRFDINTHHYLPHVMYVDLKAPIFYWENGTLHLETRDGIKREGIYMHLQKRRMNAPSQDLTSAERFYIYGNRFSAKREPRIRVVEDALGSFRFRAARLDKRSRR